MVTVLGIFMVLSSVVLFNYNKFTSDTILTNIAYEVALSVREAQIYGVSVRNPDGTNGSAEFSVPYGIHFSAVPGGTPSYYLFADSGAQTGIYDGGTSCVSGSGECVTPYTMQRGIEIIQIMNKVAGQSACSTPDAGGNLSVMFRRPNPEPIFNNANNVEYAEITLEAPNGSRRYVVIRNNGQMYVDDESLCTPVI
jgi:hypothetical protein